MARPPINWKARCVDLEIKIADLMRDKAGLERLSTQTSIYLDAIRKEASEFREQTTKYKGVIEYLEKHIDLLNETIEDLRKTNERT
jgi:predicted  nucleic acid-binding Zn-ribbon protein